MFRSPYKFRFLKEQVEDQAQTKSLTLKDKYGNAIARGVVKTTGEFIDEYSIELKDFEIYDDENHNPLELGRAFLSKLWNKLEDNVQRIYLEVKENPAYWRKLGFTHINNKYFYLDRA